MGLTLACALRRHGVDVRVLEQRPERSGLSRATEVHPRTLEILEELGVAHALVREGVKVMGVALYDDGERVTEASLLGADTPFPFILGVPQERTEAQLERRLEELGGRVERGVQALWPEADEEGVTLRVEHSDGERADLRGRYLVACDGARSAIREALHVPVQGDDWEGSYLVGDGVLVRHPAVDPGWIHVFASGSGAVTLLPLPGGRMRVIAERVADDTRLPDRALLDALVAERVGGGAALEEVDGLGAYRVHRRMAQQLRVGRVFLAGDAAHVHSPVGGLGMNLGMQEAWNLAWKLALALEGRAQEAVLDSYEAECLPVARSVVRETHIATLATSLRTPLARALRDLVAGMLFEHRGLERAAMEILAELRVQYSDSPILAERQRSVLWASVGEDRKVEAPTVVDWLDFAEGPAVGTRAPDHLVRRGSGQDAIWLSDLVRGTQHVALLFDGVAPTELGYLNLEGVSQALTERYSGLVRVVVVTPHNTPPSQLRWDGEVLLDTDQGLHRRYAARSECVYVLRPDGIIGYRGQPTHGEHLLGWLARVFV